MPSLRCLQCEYTLDGLAPQDGAVLCPECGLRQFAGDRERRERRRVSRFIVATLLPWALPLTVILLFGRMNAEWVGGTLSLMLMLAPIASALLSLAAMVCYRLPRLTGYQWVAYPLLWLLGTLGGFSACMLALATVIPLVQ